MTARRATFRQCDVSKAVKAASAGGLQVVRIEIDPSGRIVLHTGAADEGRSVGPKRACDVVDERLKRMAENG